MDPEKVRTLFVAFFLFVHAFSGLLWADNRLYSGVHVNFYNQTQISIEGPRLAFHEYESGDLEAPEVEPLFEGVFENPDCAKYLNIHATPGRDHSEEILEATLAARWRKPRSYYAFRAHLLGKASAMGHGAIRIREDERTVGDCSWSVVPAQQGNKYGTDIGVAMVVLGFEHLGLQKLVASIDPQNFGSISVAESAGFIEDPEKAYRKTTWVGWTDRLYFYLTKERYEALKKEQQRR